MLIRVWAHSHKLSLSLSSNSTGALRLSSSSSSCLPPALAIPAVRLRGRFDRRSTRGSGLL
eukprot:6201780-Prymnesium_polylepis.1